MAALYDKRDSLGLDAEQARVLDRYHTIFVRAGAKLGPRRRSASPPSPSGWRAWARSSRRTCWPTRSPISSFSTARRISKAFRPSCARRRRRRRGARPDGQARDHPLPLEHRALPAILEAARPARAGLQGLGGARRYGRRDRQQGASSPKWRPCASSARSFWATRPSPISSSADTMAKTPDAVLRLLERRLDSGSRAGEGRARRSAGPGASRAGDNIVIEPWDWRYLCRSGAHGAPQSR